MWRSANDPSLLRLVVTLVLIYLVVVSSIVALAAAVIYGLIVLFS